MSKTVTSAPSPTAITAAFAPATPPPMTVTRAERVPGTPDISRPRPPAERIRVAAPTVGARRPATSRHRREQRQAAAGKLHGLVGDRGDAVGDEPVGERAVGGEVQVGEQHEVVAEVAVLARDRLLDLEQQLGARPHLGGVVEQRRSGGLVLGIRHRRAEAGAALHEDLMAGRDQIVHSRGRQRHAVLVVLHLGGDADPHRVILSAPPLERSRSLWERL